MDIKGKPKSLIISDKALQLRLSVPTLNPIVKKIKFCQVGAFLQAVKSLKCSPIEELESALTAQLKQVKSTASIHGTHLKEKGLHISTHQEIANFSASNAWNSRFKRRHNTAYKNLSGESRSVYLEIVVENWKNYLLQEIEDEL
jgi:hypothetical protein